MQLGAESVNLVGHGDEAVFGVIDRNLNTFEEEIVDAAGETSPFGLEGTDLTAKVVSLAAEFGESDIFFGGGHVLGGARTSSPTDCIPSTSFNQKFRQA